MIKGKNIYLRRLEKEDLPQLLEWVNNPELFITMGIWGPRTSMEQNDWYEKTYHSKTNIVFAICDLGDKKHIGNVSLFDIDNKNRNCGLTIFIADENNHGKGYGTEAIELICQYAFYYLNLFRIYCKTDNEIASKMYEKIGFQKEGVLRKQVYRYGKYENKHLYGLLKDEYIPKLESNIFLSIE